MHELSKFSSKISILFTDIDDTLTSRGYLESEAFTSIWNLHDAGVRVVPVTGRPAGWCEMIARQWPVAGVIGENGGFYFRYINKKMMRFFYVDEPTRILNRQKLAKIESEILKNVPGTAVASDQFCRLMDLAIDFCEDVPPLSNDKVKQIVNIFNSNGANAKVSSIHVNGWFGNYDKTTMTKKFLKQELLIDEQDWQKSCAFVGDSPNDEPMFGFFPNSFGVANIRAYSSQMTALPKYIATKNGGDGFAQIAKKVIKNLNL